MKEWSLPASLDIDGAVGLLQPKHLASVFIFSFRTFEHANCPLYRQMALNGGQVSNITISACLATSYICYHVLPVYT